MLSIKNLEAGYGKVHVLHGISIDVPKGKVVTLIGSNGAGKTTTMRAISGMIKPTSGEINLSGKRIDGIVAGFHAFMDAAGPGVALASDALGELGAALGGASGGMSDFGISEVAAAASLVGTGISATLAPT